MDELFHGRYKETDEGFELLENLKTKTAILGFSHNTRYVSLDVYGNLYIRIGFVWNASGPTIDSLNTREASCYHDGVYTLANAGAFKGPHSDTVRALADELLYDTLRSNGMWWVRAQIWHKSVRLGGGSYWETEKPRYKNMYMKRKKRGYRRH